jgi:hypothetical protein
MSTGLIDRFFSDESGYIHNSSHSYLVAFMIKKTFLDYSDTRPLHEDASRTYGRNFNSTPNHCPCYTKMPGAYTGALTAP